MICLSKVLGCAISGISCAARTLTWRETEIIFCQKVSVTHGAVTPDLVGGTNLQPLWLQKLMVTSEDKPKTHARRSKAHHEQCTLLLPFELCCPAQPSLRHLVPPAAIGESPFTVRTLQCALWSAQQLQGARHVDNGRLGRRPVASQGHVTVFQTSTLHG